MEPFSFERHNEAQRGVQLIPRPRLLFERQQGPRIHTPPLSLGLVNSPVRIRFPWLRRQYLYIPCTRTPGQNSYIPYSSCMVPHASARGGKHKRSDTIRVSFSRRHTPPPLMNGRTGSPLCVGLPSLTPRLVPSRTSQHSLSLLLFRKNAGETKSFCRATIVSSNLDTLSHSPRATAKKRTDRKEERPSSRTCNIHHTPTLTDAPRQERQPN